MADRRTRVLFVDDDQKLLDLLQELMSAYAEGRWDIYTATDTAKALAILQQLSIDLLVLDVHMPVVDGVQFLRLLQRRFPNLIKVMLTGDHTGAFRAACLNAGAELFLEKPRDAGGWESIHATLSELAKFQPEQGFRGVLRQVGLHDVLQMECLACNSSVLEVRAGETSGLIFIEGGRIVHAQTGDLAGVEAFNRLLSYAGGEFSLRAFTEPPQRTISDTWESLLMDAAQKRDEGAEQPVEAEPAPLVDESGRPPVESQADGAKPAPGPAPTAAVPPETVASVAPTQPKLRPQIDEVLICSARGEVLYEWQCAKVNARIGFLEFLSKKAQLLQQGLPIGLFDRLELEAPASRVVVQILATQAVFVRSSRVPAQGQP